MKAKRVVNSKDGNKKITVIDNKIGDTSSKDVEGEHPEGAKNTDAPISSTPLATRNNEQKDEQDELFGDNT